MRRAARVDDNQKEIVEAARKMGCTVQLLHSVGQGCPDLLVGISGTNDLWEVKDGRKTASHRRLTDDQVKWHSEWRGRVCVIRSVDEAIARVNEIRLTMRTT